MTNQKYLEKYLDLLKYRQMSERTIQGYEQDIKYFFRFIQKQCIHDLKNITKQEIDEYQTYLYYRKTKKGKPLATETQIKKLSTITNFFRALVQTGLLIYNPAKDIQLPRHGSRLPQNMLSAKEIKLILKAPDHNTICGFRDRAILELLYSTGIRTAEFMRLQLDDCKTRDGFLRIIKGKGLKDRTIPMGSIAVQYTAEYIKNVRPCLQKKHSDSTLFLTRTGSVYDSSSLDRMIKRYGKKAGITRHISARAFRTTMATAMLRGGADIRQIQEILGHKNLSTTQLYLYIVKDDLKRVHSKTHPREQVEPEKDIRYEGSDD